MTRTLAEEVEAGEDDDDLKMMLGNRMKPAISKEVTKLSSTRNRRKRKKD